MSAPWWAALRPAESQLSCGTEKHLVRWADGQLTAADHPDTEGELVLAALGGDKADCVALVEAWGAHADDLDVLALGPRSPADQLAVTGDLVRSLRSAIPEPGGPPRLAQRHGPRPAARPRSLPMRQVSPELHRAQVRRAELIGLFALGRDFQLALSAAVAAAWSAGPAPGRDVAAARPALTGALAGSPRPRPAGWASTRRRCTPRCTRRPAGARSSWPGKRSGPRSRCAGWPPSGRPVSRSSAVTWSWTCWRPPGRGRRCGRCPGRARTQLS